MRYGIEEMYKESQKETKVGRNARTPTYRRYELNRQDESRTSGATHLIRYSPPQQNPVIKLTLMHAQLLPRPKDVGTNIIELPAGEAE